MEAGAEGRASSGEVAYGKLLWVGPLAGVLAAVVNVVVYLLASALGAIPPDVVTPNGAPVTVGDVVTRTFAPALLGALLFAVLGRFTRRPVRNFRAVAGVALVLSFVGPPFVLVGAPVAMILALYLMHVVAAVVITGVLTTLGTRSRA